MNLVRRQQTSVDADPQDTVGSHTFAGRRMSAPVKAGSLREETDGQTAGDLVKLR